MPDSSFYVDDAAVTARKAEVPEANFDNGANVAASNSPCIGINAGGGEVTGEPQQFTLTDQDGDARTPQVGQTIGEGVGKGTKPVGIATPSVEGDGEITDKGDATLATLGAGWVATP